MKWESLQDLSGLTIEGPLLLIPNSYSDERGFFMESWNQKKFDQIIGQKINFVQDNHSSSSLGVVRGLHYQIPPFEQGKLVRCISGEIYDVAIDLRVTSCTFGHWAGAALSSKNKHQLWIPPGFAHGFFASSEFVEVIYKVTNYWNKDCERSIRWDDEMLNIHWPEFTGEFKLSKKDLNACFLKDLKKNDLF